MKRIFFMTLFVALTTIAYSQTDDKGYEEGKWVLKGVTGLNLSQTAMSNWSAGGENSVAGNAYLKWGHLTHKSGVLVMGNQSRSTITDYQRLNRRE